MNQTYRSHSRMLTLKLILGPVLFAAILAAFYYLSGHAGGAR